jgi:hypothetical protein
MVHANGTKDNTKRTSPHHILLCVNVMDAACHVQQQEGQNRLWNNRLISLQILNVKQLLLQTFGYYTQQSQI